MFTLKVASGSNRLWFAEVGQVSLISQQSIPADVFHPEGGVKGEPLGVWDGYSPAWYVDFEERPAKLLSLLWVVYGPAYHINQDAPREHYLVTEYAWLLGPTGDTIDRVAP